jgi:hypothetical protein
MRRAADCRNPASHLIPVHFVSYDDLIELARLCLKQAAATSNPTAAAELRRMASEYQTRAQASDGGRRMSDSPAAFKTSPQGTQPSQQQQQPQAIDPTLKEDPC